MRNKREILEGIPNSEDLDDIIDYVYEAIDEIWGELHSITDRLGELSIGNTGIIEDVHRDLKDLCDDLY